MLSGKILMLHTTHYLKFGRNAHIVHRMKQKMITLPKHIITNKLVNNIFFIIYYKNKFSFYVYIYLSIYIFLYKFVP